MYIFQRDVSVCLPQLERKQSKNDIYISRTTAMSEGICQGRLYLGLMTTFTVSDEEGYQFLHLSIQKFLAAWWIAKYNENTEEILIF